MAKEWEKALREVQEVQWNLNIMHVLPREGSITLSSSLKILEHDEKLLLGHQGIILNVC